MCFIVAGVPEGPNTTYAGGPEWPGGPPEAFLVEG